MLKIFSLYIIILLLGSCYVRPENQWDTNAEHLYGQDHDFK